MRAFVFAICAALAVAACELEDVAEIRQFAAVMHDAVCELPEDHTVRVKARAALAKAPTVVGFLENAGRSPYC